jgi:hypothetical protein
VNKVFQWQKGVDMRRSQHLQSDRMIHFGLGIGLIIAALAIATLYVSNERYFYFWDYLAYSFSATELMTAFQTSTVNGLQVFFDSLAEDYNKLSSLLLMPFLLIFGDSRLVYILSCTLVYFVPFCLLIGHIATKLIPIHPKRVFWAAAYLSLLFPANWIGILRGYPDLGGATLMALASLVYLRDVKLKRWWQIPLMGLLLALAILFRRPFAYSVRAFVLAIGLQGAFIYLVSSKQTIQVKLRNLLLYIIRVALTSIIALAILWITAPEFAYRALTVNYHLLYAAYEQPTGSVIQYYMLQYGLLACVFAVLGLGMAIAAYPTAQNSCFISLFGGLSIAQWMLIVRQLGLHYTTHFNFVIILGLISFFWSCWLRTRRWERLGLLWLSGFLVSVNIMLGMSNFFIKNNLISYLFAINNPPLVRKDYNQITSLVAYLREVALPHDSIYVAASSVALNSSLLATADDQLHPMDSGKLNIIETSDVDARDVYPLERLLQSQYVLITVPFQHHLLPEEQDVVKVVVDLFADYTEFSQDFEKLPRIFTLDTTENFKLAYDFERLSKSTPTETKVAMIVYRRVRPTTLGTTLRTLEIMRKAVQPMPGSQASWLILGEQGSVPRRYPAQTQKTISGNAKMQFNDISKASLLYFGAIPTTAKLVGELGLLDNQCTGLSIQLVALDRQGKAIRGVQTQYSSKDIHQKTLVSLSLQISGENSAYLYLDLDGFSQVNDVNYCNISLNNLAISDE